MLLQMSPRTTKEELYGREVELETLLRLLRTRVFPVVIIGGIKRIGKTSLALVASKELEKDNGYSVIYLPSYIEGGFNAENIDLYKTKAKRSLKDPVEFIHEACTQSERLIIVIDEAQSMSLRLRKSLRKLVSLVINNTCASLLLPSSSPGLVKDLVIPETDGSPLSYLTYYTSCYEIWLNPLKHDVAESLLADGLREHGLSPPRSLIRDAVDFFGGVPGWLVFFGLRLIEGKSPKEIYREAIETALREIKSLAPRPQLLLKVIAEGNSSWSEALLALERLEGRKISRNGFAKALHYLEKRALIYGYKILDPVYEKAAKLLDPREPLAKLKQRYRPRKDLG